MHAVRLNLNKKGTAIPGNPLIFNYRFSYGVTNVRTSLLAVSPVYPFALTNHV